MTTVAESVPPKAKQAWQVWRDRRGHLSVLRIATLLVLLIPLFKALIDSHAITYGARPLNDLIHRTGFWALIFLGLSLAVTPFRRILRNGGLIDVRRMIGVAAFIYIATHLLLFIADQSYDLAKVANELARRVYLVIGSIAWIGLAVLAATSTDRMVRRLGGMRWRRLHQLVYVCALLGLIHYFQQTKADVAVPTFAAAILTWLMGYRLLVWWRGAAALSAAVLAALAIVVSLLTFAGEAIGIALTFNASPWRVLESAFDFGAGIRPGWQVLGAGLAVALLDFVFARWRESRGRSARGATP